MSNRETPFGKKNYIFLGIFTAVIILGFGLMALESSAGFKDASQFSLSLYICPILIIGGFAGVIYAILIKPDLPLEPEPAEKRRTSSRRKSDVHFPTKGKEVSSKSGGAKKGTRNKSSRK